MVVESKERPCREKGGEVFMKKRVICLILALVMVCPAVLSASALTGLNIFATARFSQSYPVYSGPGAYYYRSNEGKATYGGGGVARVYGVAGDWVLIGYEMASGDYRIGYIERDALKTMYDVKGTINYSLSFSGTTVWAANTCSLTDDPVINNKTIYMVPQGSTMTALGTMGTEWVYVEVLGTSSYMRGFVRKGNVSYTPIYSGGTSKPTATPSPAVIPNVYYHDYNKGSYLPSFQNVRFSRSYPVYSGPAEYYYRANEGKATMGGGVCRLYGVENGWALIGYELSGGGFRIGYVEASALPQIGLRIPYLDLSYRNRTVLSATYVTDDIVMNKKPVLNLSAGTPVLFLGLSYGLSTTWAYVEVMGTSSLMRGFIPASSLGM